MCVCVCVCVCVLIAQSCLTLYDPMDCSLPGSSVHGILQSRILEWVAMSSSRGSSQPRDQTQVSCIAGRFFTIWATRKSWSWPTGSQIPGPGGDRYVSTHISVSRIVTWLFLTISGWACNLHMNQGISKISIHYFPSSFCCMKKIILESMLFTTCWTCLTTWTGVFDTLENQSFPLGQIRTRGRRMMVTF